MNLADIAVHGRKFALEGWGGCVCVWGVYSANCVPLGIAAQTRLIPT